jgi:hypothetical protein
MLYLKGEKVIICGLAEVFCLQITEEIEFANGKIRKPPHLASSKNDIYAYVLCDRDK